MKKNFLVKEIQFVSSLQVDNSKALIITIKAFILNILRYKKTTEETSMVKCAIRGSNPGHPD